MINKIIIAETFPSKLEKNLIKTGRIENHDQLVLMYIRKTRAFFFWFWQWKQQKGRKIKLEQMNPTIWGILSEIFNLHFHIPCINFSTYKFRHTKSCTSIILCNNIYINIFLEYENIIMQYNRMTKILWNKVLSAVSFFFSDSFLILFNWLYNRFCIEHGYKTSFLNEL